MFFWLIGITITSNIVFYLFYTTYQPVTCCTFPSTGHGSGSLDRCVQISLFGPGSLPLLPATAQGQLETAGLSLSRLADWESYGFRVARSERHQTDSLGEWAWLGVSGTRLTPYVGGRCWYFECMHLATNNETDREFYTQLHPWPPCFKVGICYTDLSSV